MANTVSFRPGTGDVPDSPGVYRFRDTDGVVIYVGKARSLRSRLNSYFSEISSLHPRTRAMVEAAADVDWVTVANEVEALQVEYSWIKQYDPRFNVRYRDDKSYPYLAVTMSDEFPRVHVVRGAKKKGVRYFGPYAHAWAIRDTVDQLLRVFPIRSCSAGVFQRHKRIGRPCLLNDIGKCSAPCVGQISPEDHRDLAEDMCRFLGGRTEEYIATVEQSMKNAASKQDYESAARLRDNVAALRRALERSAVVLPDNTAADVIALADDELESSLQVFHVRGGRVTGQRSFIVEKTVDADPGELIEQFLLQLYGDSDPTDGRTVPREVLVSHDVTNRSVVRAWLAERRGTNVHLGKPSRGPKRRLMETVSQNAQQALTLHKIRRAGDLTARGQALQELQDYLGLVEAPLRIECIDISGHHGTDLTASIVVFEDGLVKKSQYRKYAIADHQDDLSAMYEAVSRRFGRVAGKDAADKDVAGKDAAGKDVVAKEDGEARDGPRRYRTSLLVVDGASGQVHAAVRALQDAGVQGVAVCGLAKRLEEVWVADQLDPIILPRRSEGLYLLQRIRDEAHRFAVAYHRQRRAKRSQSSALDAIEGLGPVKRKALLKHFGSVRKIRSATEGEIAGVKGIGPVLAASVARSLAETGNNGGVNVTTGEVLEGAD